MKSKNLFAALLPAFRQANAVPKRLLDNLQSPRIFAALGSAYLGCAIGFCVFRFPPDPLLGVFMSPVLLGLTPWIPSVNLLLLVAVISIIAFSISRLPYYWLGVIGVLFACTAYFSIDAWRLG